MSNNKFRYAWYEFLRLLDITFAEGFSCPECGTIPGVVVMDGVSLGMRKVLAEWGTYGQSAQSGGKGSSQFDGR